MPAVFTEPATLYVSSTYGGTGTASATWANWNANWYSLGAVSTGGTTNAFISTTGATQWITWNTALEETAEQAAARAQAQASASARLAEQQRLREEARARSEELLLLMLSDEQAASRREHGWFAVRGSKSGRTYRIHSRGVSNNVDRLSGDGRRERIFCAHPAGIPVADVHLAQMLALATDEDAFLRVANSHAAPLTPVTRGGEYAAEPPLLQAA